MIENKINKLIEITNDKKVVLLFPGQASQYKNMGLDWYNNSDKFKTIIDYINQKIKEYNTDIDLFSILQDESKLNITLYSQIAIFSISMASYETIKEAIEKKTLCLTGHSLGEYSALCAASSISLDQATNLVLKRGYFMHNYSKKGTMFAVIWNFNLDTIKILEELVKKYNSVIANYNSYNQLIVSCPIEVYENLVNEVKNNFKNCKVIPLKVSGAFHSYLMNEANELMKQEIEKTQFSKPQKDLFLNSQLHKDPKEIKKTLSNQIINPIHWIQTIQNINNYYKEDFIFLELLPNKVLTNLIKKGFDSSIQSKIVNLEEI
jgi:[acyl-carrier-protein] S-malonyltransferase